MTETTKTIGTQIYTATEDGAYLDPNGGEWIDERKDVKSKIRYNEREIARSDDPEEIQGLRREIASDREDLALMEELFGR